VRKSDPNTSLVLVAVRKVVKMKEKFPKRRATISGSTGDNRNKKSGNQKRRHSIGGTGQGERKMFNLVAGLHLQEMEVLANLAIARIIALKIAVLNRTKTLQPSFLQRRYSRLRNESG